jgi:V-type H+-transporting ATPase proteolipid subunit
MTSDPPPYILMSGMTLHCSYGTAKSSIGISATSIIRPDFMVRSCVPVVMAGIIAVCLSGLAAEDADDTDPQNVKIYGLVVSVVISDNCMSPFLLPLLQN